MARRALAFLLALAVGLACAPAAAASDTWRELRRPLQLPELAPGEPCPVSSLGEGVDWEAVNAFGYGAGPGPVYPGIGGTEPPSHIVVRPIPNEAPWQGTKVFWYVKPSYRGPVLIRGARIDGPGLVRFANHGGNDRHPRDLRIMRDEEVSWDGQPPGSRGVPSGVLVRSSGCFAAQMDGTRFSRTVVFTAETQ